MRFNSSTFGLIPTVQHAIHAMYLRLFVLAGAIIISLTQTSSSFAAAAKEKAAPTGDDFDAPIRFEWAKNFDGLFDYLNGNFRGLIIGLSIVLLPAIILMLIVGGRSKEKSIGWMRWGAVVLGGVFIAIWLPTIGEALIVTPQEAAAK